MKNRAKLVIIAALLYVLQLVFVPFSNVQASGLSSNMDVVFVMDSSGSMKESDPEQIRTEAIKMFLDMGQVQGNKIGLVAYSDDIVREHSLDALNSEQDKNRIKDMASNIPFGQKTDTGRGLLEGEKLLDSGHDKNNRPLIILLSDGKNDPQRSSKESLDDLNNAINLCKSKGYPVYTIGLNYDGTVDKSQLKEISDATKGKNYITNTAADLPGIITDIYAENSKVKIQDQGTITANGSFQDLKVNIPNSNVLEANISMLTDKPVEVKLADPLGKEIAIPSSNAILTTSKKYSILKLVKPVKGQWDLKIKGESGTKIKLSYIFNYDLQLEANFSPKDAHKGDNINVTAYLTSNGQKASDKGLYDGIKAVLIVKNLKNSSVKEIPLNVNSDEFKGQYSLPDNGNYELKVRVDGNSFYRESKAVVIGGEAAAQSSSSALKSPKVLGRILSVVLILAGIIIFGIMKKKRIQGFGRVELHIKDENTSEVLSPQFRNLDNYSGSFTLFDVLGLKEEYSETEKVKFVFKADDSIQLINNSQCVVQRAGKKLDKDFKVVLYDKNKITILLNKVPKSITVEFHAK